MNDPSYRPSKKEPSYELHIPPDLAPDYALEVVMGLCHEMRHPINKIEDFATILSDPYSADLHEEAIQQILLLTDGLRYILNIVYAYDKEREYPLQDAGEDF